jgi:hypothetical protein
MGQNTGAGSCPGTSPPQKARPAKNRTANTASNVTAELAPLNVTAPLARLAVLRVLGGGTLHQAAQRRRETLYELYTRDAVGDIGALLHARDVVEHLARELLVV